MADMLNCLGFRNHSASYTYFSHFSIFSLSLLILPNPLQFQFPPERKVKWWEERWNKVASHIWHHQGKTCQSFWAGACLWLWEWAATVSGEPRPLSHQGKALERTGCKGPSWLDLISGRPINWQDCTASLWTLGIRMRGGKWSRRHNRKERFFHSFPSFCLFSLTVAGIPRRIGGCWHFLVSVVRKKLVKWWAVGDSCELSWINSPSLTLFSKAAKPVHSDNGRCSALELRWFIAGGISITALATGGEREREMLARREEEERHSDKFSTLCTALQHVGHIWDERKRWAGGIGGLKKGCVCLYECKFSRKNTLMCPLSPLL